MQYNQRNHISSRNQAWNPMKEALKGNSCFITVRGDKAGQAGIQMWRADLEWKVKWGSEVGGQPAKWELKGMKTDKCKERERLKEKTIEEREE